MSLRLGHILEAQQFSRAFLDRELFPRAREFQDRLHGDHSPNRRLDILRDRCMWLIFMQPSTRTWGSFASAMWYLGGDSFGIENAAQFSSMVKGESIEDTMRILRGYRCDVIVFRSAEAGDARRAASVLEHTALINAGDGTGQHPTQALLDVYTIQQELGRLDNICVALVGDLANGRTVRSLAYLLAKYEGVEFYFVAHPVVKMRDDIKAYLARHNVPFTEVEDVHEIAARADVVYQTRIQKERFGDRAGEFEQARGRNTIDQGVLDLMPEHAIVMHPFPRDSRGGQPEIALEVDTDSRAAYFRQAENGLYVRMALLDRMLG